MCTDSRAQLIDLCMPDEAPSIFCQCRVFGTCCLRHKYEMSTKHTKYVQYVQNIQL